MKLLSTVFLSALFLLTACSKKEGVENDGLIGKWQLTEVYDGYANGGGFKWNTIPTEDAHSLKFATNGDFTQENNNRGNSYLCVGTYTIFPGMKIQVTDNCSLVPYTKSVTELSPSTLIIDVQGIEGIIRFKYKAVSVN